MSFLFISGPSRSRVSKNEFGPIFLHLLRLVDNNCILYIRYPGDKCEGIMTERFQLITTTSDEI